MNEYARSRILNQVKQWKRRRGIATSPAKVVELAALVAEAEANGIDGASGLRREQFTPQIQGLREIAKEFRQEADEAKRKERTL